MDNLKELVDEYGKLALTSSKILQSHGEKLIYLYDRIGAEEEKVNALLTNVQKLIEINIKQNNTLQLLISEIASAKASVEQRSRSEVLAELNKKVDEIFGEEKSPLYIVE